MDVGLETQEVDSLEARTQAVIEKLKGKPIIRDALELQAEKSPQNLRYHDGKAHPKDVLHEIILFATKDGVSDERFLEILAIDAVYHDIGFLDQYAKNEGVGAEKTKEAMRKTGQYSEEEIRIVGEDIEDTEVLFEDGVLKQRQARNRSGKYLLDADVSNLGRVDFSEKSKLLFEELTLQSPNNPPNEVNFLKATYGFVKNHQWQTEAAQKLRQAQQDINVQNLGQQLGEAT